MNNDQNYQHNELDSLISDNHLQMMKAALPYVNVTQQRFLSLFVKMNELRRTMNLFQDTEVATMGICSAGEGPASMTPFDMLNAIKPFASSGEQDFIDLITNFLQGFRLANSYSEQAPAPSTMARAPEMPRAQATVQEVHENHEYREQPQENLPHRSAGPFSRLPIDQLKNFMPPEQQSRFETMQMMMSAMQQLN